MKQNILLLLMCTAVLFSSCEKKWDEHTEVKDANFTTQLLDQINKNPDLSKFAEYLKQTHYDDTLRSSKSYTVWAPTNQALAAVNPDLIDSDAKLLRFVENHIANQTFLTTAVGSQPLRIKTLNDKTVAFTATSVDGSPIISKDLYLADGVLHVISAAITPKQSAWEYLMSTNTIQKQVLSSLTTMVFDPQRAEVLNIDPLTGKPNYKPGTGFYSVNKFLDRDDFSAQSGREADISHEDSTFTYIVLTDAAFTAERSKLSKYFKVTGTDQVSIDTTNNLTDFNIIKDLAFKGILDKENFPANVLSVGDSVRFHLDKNAVVETHQVSNGVVYVMSSINYDLGNGTFDMYTKLKPIIIQGESINNSINSDASLSNVKLTNGTFETRLRKDPDGHLYSYVYRVNHGNAVNWSRYRPAQVNSVKYKVFWRVVRDYALEPAAKAIPAVPGSTLVYSPLRFAIGIPANVTPGFNYVTEPGAVRVMNPVTNTQKIDPVTGKYVYAPDYEERYLGEFTAARYYSNKLKDGIKSTLAVYQVGANSTPNGTNDIILDYIKLVPVP
ncbi:MAG: fasciclin domain-containing protein [Sphingobacteriaceae bacterium]|nr:fasciclin domain-containing protein [Sphingobacteriaceae bacterium]